MKTNLTDIQKLTLDIMNGSVEKYSVKEAEDVIRKAIVDACGGEWNFYKFQKNKWDVFALISEVLSAPMGRDLSEIYGNLVEVRDTNLGDSPVFEIEDTSLFRVGVIANGNQDTRRQELYSSKLTISTDRLAVKIYADFDMYITGRINFPRMVERVQKSFDNKVNELIVNAIYGAYTADARLKAPYKVNGTTVTDEALMDLIAHVEAETGSEVTILGTAKALAKIPNAQPSEVAKREKELLGYYGNFHSRQLVELPQVHKNGTSQFAVADDFLLVVPTGERIVKVLFEGDATVYEGEAKDRNDEQIEFFFARRVGVSVLTASKYGYFRIA